EEPIWIGYDLVAPGERMVFESYFPDSLPYQMVHTVVRMGEAPVFDTLATIKPQRDSVVTPYGDEFYVYKAFPAATRSLDSVRPWFDKPPDKRITLTGRMGGMNHMAMKE